MSKIAQEIKLKEPAINLFDEVAETAAKVVAEAAERDRKKVNKNTQLRQFYNEIVSWDAKSQTMNEDEFKQQIPLLRMLSARVAYAKGRELVDENYKSILEACVSQVEDKETMKNAKLFMEAFTGFYKMYRPADNH